MCKSACEIQWRPQVQDIFGEQLIHEDINLPASR
jgi:hypothetical protein